MKKLKIAYVTIYDGTNVSNWSGLSFYISDTLRKYVGDIEYIGNLRNKKFIKNYFKKGYCKLIERKYFYEDRTEEVGKFYARQVEEQIKGKNFDIIFSPGSIPIAYLETKTPKIFWTDANWHSMLGYYFYNVSRLSILDGDNMEQRALDTSLLAIFSSDWAADTAIEQYNIDKDKVKVIPFGANLNNIPDEYKLKHELNKIIKLLFVGKSWERKGGKIAFNTMKELNKHGVDANLTIVGCIPPPIYQLNDEKVTVIPFLDKSKKKDNETFRKLYLESDFFIVPSRMEAYGVVFCEAAAFGLPVLSSITGGITTIIKNGINGYLLPLEADGKEFAEKIIKIKQSGHYEKLRCSSRQRYDEILNWDAAGKTIRKEIEKLI